LFISTLQGQTILTTEESYQDYFFENKDSLDPMEGIWNVFITKEYYNYDTLNSVIKLPEATKIALLKKENKIISYKISGEPFNVEFSNTEVKGVYLYRNYFAETGQYSKSQAIISKAGEMEYTYDIPDEYLRLKSDTSYKEGMRVVHFMRWNKILPLK
jgi:hypothetical protein